MIEIRWLDAPEDHDYPAAADYLSLVLAPDVAKKLAKKLKDSEPWEAKAKDIARAAGVTLLTHSDPHVARDLEKIKADTPLSPILLIRGSLTDGRPLVIADGYHRVCAVNHIEPNTVVPARIVDL